MSEKKPDNTDIDPQLADRISQQLRENLTTQAIDITAIKRTLKTERAAEDPIGNTEYPDLNGNYRSANTILGR